MPHNTYCTIRPETDRDGVAIERVHTRAFGRSNEAELVNRLRAGIHWIPALSLVAVNNEDIVGHILFTTVHIDGDDGGLHAVLALAPMAVEPLHQRLGIGQQLIRSGVQRAREIGADAVIVLGHAEYYPKTGFRPASQWNVRAPFAVPDEYFMALELHEHGLQGKSGVVVYPAEFANV